MRYQRFARLVTLSCVALAFALAACTSTPTEEGGTGSLEAKLTMTFPPMGADKQVDQICGTIWCTGIDPILGVPRPSQAFPEEWCADVSTTEGEDGFGLLAKRGLSAPGDCTIYAKGTTTDLTTTCEDTVTFPVTVNDVTDIIVYLNCITDPLYGGVDAFATTNSCPGFRQILVTPTTQSIGSDFTVRTEVYDPEGEDANVRVESDCGTVDDSLQQRQSCTHLDGSLCDAAETMVTCDDVQACTITVTVEAIDPRELEGCNGLLPDSTDNDAAKQTIDVICQQALACGDGDIVSPETCDPPSSPPNAANENGVWCDAGCQEVEACNPVNRFCETATEAGLDDECVIATTCTAPATPTTEGTMPTCGFDFVGIGAACGSIGDECDGQGTCVTGQACPAGNPSGCDVVVCNVASCPAGLCEYAADSTQDGRTCDSGMGSTEGACNGTTGNCDSLDECTALNVSGCSTTGGCWDATCDTNTGGAWVCDEKTDDTNSCNEAPCTSGTCGCISGTCFDVVDVCQQYSPVPATRVAACDPVLDPCICEKPVFLAVDCNLINTFSVPVPLAASLQQFGVANANESVAVSAQDAVVLPGSLVCGFIDNNFTSAQVWPSSVIVNFSNAAPASATLDSFVDDNNDGEATNPHNPTLVSFFEACGAGCVSGGCVDANGDPTSETCGITDDCTGAGEGPGIVVPTLAGTGSLPSSPPAPFLLTPTANPVNATTGYADVAFNLVEVGGIITGCIGGSANCDNAEICGPDPRTPATDPSLIVGPRITYDAECNKIQAANLECLPFDSFSGYSDVCGGKLDATNAIQGLEPYPDCCDPTGDILCLSAANATRCCDALAARYPTATDAQFPQLWVNP